MLEHAIRLHTRRQNYLFKFATFYRHILRFIVSVARYIISCQILLSFHLRMMTWSHRNVV